MNTDNMPWKGHPSEPYIEALITALNTNPYLPPADLLKRGWVKNWALNLYRQRINTRGLGITQAFQCRAKWSFVTTGDITDKAVRKSRYRPIVMALFACPDEMAAYIKLRPSERRALLKMADHGSQTQCMLLAAQIYVAAIRKGDKGAKMAERDLLWAPWDYYPTSSFEKRYAWTERPLSGGQSKRAVLLVYTDGSMAGLLRVAEQVSTSVSSVWGPPFAFPQGTTVSEAKEALLNMLRLNMDKNHE